MRVDPYDGAPRHVSMVDGFDDASIDTAVWGTKVENGGTGITEAGGFLTIANAAGDAGISWLPTLHNYGNYIICQAEITVVDGEATGDGERCEASLVWYKDADNYIKWGAYRDTSEAVNSSGYLRYNIGGAGETAVDVTSAVIDNSAHTFKLVKHESQILVYYDGDYQTGFAFPEVLDYAIRLEAGTETNGDTIDIDFNDFKLYNHTDPFGTDLTNVTTGITTIQGLLENGTYGLSALETLVDDLESRLSATRAGYLDNLAHYGITVGSGTLQIPLNSVEYAVEFTTATWGSVFELTFIADLDKNSSGFDTNAKANTVLEIKIYKEFSAAYPSLPQDIWAIQKDVTLDRNVDIDHIRCAQDTKIAFEVDLVPDDTIDVPYTYIVRRLKT